MSFAAVDPMAIGVGARPLGMGKAYVAVAEDGDTVFLNPAGLGKTKSLKLTSMYTNLMNDAQYIVIGGAYPTQGLGAFGGGVICANVADIMLFSDSFVPEGSGSYGNHVFFLSYGVGLKELNIPYISSSVGEDVYVGANLKYFMQGGTGSSSIEAGDGTGLDVDLGLLYTPYEWLSFGACAQNILPEEAGGKIVFKSGIEEGIPSNIKLGMKLGLIGSGLLNVDGHKLDFALDFDMSPIQKHPGATYMGLEYTPIEMLTLRVGANSLPNPYDAPLNITGGIGLRYEGVEFNYAYHPFDNIPDNASHFFSISLVGKEDKPAPSPPPKKDFGLSLSSPADKTIIYDNSIDIDGRVDNYAPGVFVQANRQDIPVDDHGNISGVLPIRKFGKNLIVVSAADKDGNEVEEKVRLLRFVSFDDVRGDYWARRPIEYSATAGLVEGYPDGTFKPERALSRAELATLLVRARGIELPETIDRRVFPDIPTTHWAARYIKVASEMGLVEGYPDGTFRPNDQINRAEGVLVLARFEGLPEERNLSSGPYLDMPRNHWASPLVSAAKDAGFLDYIKADRFEPRRPLTRAEAVEILSKTTFAGKRIEWLLDWDTGFEGSSVFSEPEFHLKTFKDVPARYWAAKPIEALATIGVVGGYPDGTYKPENTLTRAELSKLLVAARGIEPEKVTRAPFADVPRGHWAAHYIKEAVDMGLVRGYPDGTFRPNRRVTRAEAVTVLTRFDDTPVAGEVLSRPFPDVSQYHWSARFVEAAKDQGMLDYLRGRDFEPDRGLTRAETAELFTRTRFGEQRIREELGQEFLNKFIIKYSYQGETRSRRVVFPQ